MSLYYYIYYALSHILQRRWRITPNILLLLFCCYFFVTGIPQTLTPYCGCRFCVYFIFLFIAQGRLIVCVCFLCIRIAGVYSCIWMRVQCYVISVAVLLLFFFFLLAFFLAAHENSNSDFWASTVIGISINLLSCFYGEKTRLKVLITNNSSIRFK